MHQTAAGFCDTGVNQIGPHRCHGMDVKQKDQQRRHQRAAAHAGHPDQEADGKAGYDKKGLDGREQGHEIAGVF